MDQDSDTTQGPVPMGPCPPYSSVIRDRTDTLIRAIRPAHASLDRRENITNFMKALVASCFSDSSATVHLLAFGSVPLRTFLPDGDIDLSIMSSDSSLKDHWAQRLAAWLEEDRPDAEFKVMNVQIINAEVKLLKCLVDNVVVDISYHQIGGIRALRYLEEVDRVLPGHIFKESVILIKAWCYYESRVLGAHHGLFSTYALEVLVLHVFNRHHKAIAHPIQVLYLFLLECSRFDWDRYCLCLKGRIPLNSFPDYTVEVLVSDEDALLTPAIEAECLRKARLDEQFSELSAPTPAPTPPPESNGPSTPTATPTSSTGAATHASAIARGPAVPAALARPPGMFVIRCLNIQDPLQPSNNVGRSVTRGNMYRIRKAFAHGASVLEKILRMEDSVQALQKLDEYFKNVWNAQRLDHHQKYMEQLMRHKAEQQQLSEQQQAAPQRPQTLPGTAQDSTQPQPRLPPHLPHNQQQHMLMMQMYFAQMQQQQQQQSHPQRNLQGHGQPGQGMPNGMTVVYARNAGDLHLNPFPQQSQHHAHQRQGRGGQGSASGPVTPSAAQPDTPSSQTGAPAQVVLDESLMSAIQNQAHIAAIQAVQESQLRSQQEGGGGSGNPPVNWQQHQAALFVSYTQQLQQLAAAAVASGGQQSQAAAVAAAAAAAAGAPSQEGAAVAVVGGKPGEPAGQVTKPASESVPDSEPPVPGTETDSSVGDNSRVTTAQSPISAAAAAAAYANGMQQQRALSPSNSPQPAGQLDPTGPQAALLQQLRYLGALPPAADGGHAAENRGLSSGVGAAGGGARGQQPQDVQAGAIPQWMNQLTPAQVQALAQDLERSGVKGPADDTRSAHSRGSSHSQHSLNLQAAHHDVHHGDAAFGDHPPGVRVSSGGGVQQGTHPQAPQQGHFVQSHYQHQQHPAASIQYARAMNAAAAAAGLGFPDGSLPGGLSPPLAFHPHLPPPPPPALAHNIPHSPPSWTMANTARQAALGSGLRGAAGPGGPGARDMWSPGMMPGMLPQPPPPQPPPSRPPAHQPQLRPPVPSGPAAQQPQQPTPQPAVVVPLGPAEGLPLSDLGSAGRGRNDRVGLSATGSGTLADVASIRQSQAGRVPSLERESHDLMWQPSADSFSEEPSPRVTSPTDPLSTPPAVGVPQSVLEQQPGSRGPSDQGSKPATVVGHPLPVLGQAAAPSSSSGPLPLLPPVQGGAGGQQPSNNMAPLFSPLPQRLLMEAMLPGIFQPGSFPLAPPPQGGVSAGGSMPPGTTASSAGSAAGQPHQPSQPPQPGQLPAGLTGPVMLTHGGQTVMGVAGHMVMPMAFDAAGHATPVMGMPTPGFNGATMGTPLQLHLPMFLNSVPGQSGSHMTHMLQGVPGMVVSSQGGSTQQQLQPQTSGTGALLGTASQPPQPPQPPTSQQPPQQHAPPMGLPGFIDQLQSQALARGTFNMLQLPPLPGGIMPPLPLPLGVRPASAGGAGAPQASFVPGVVATGRPASLGGDGDAGTRGGQEGGVPGTPQGDTPQRPMVHGQPLSANSTGVYHGPGVDTRALSSPAGRGHGRSNSTGMPRPPGPYAIQVNQGTAASPSATATPTAQVMQPTQPGLPAATAAPAAAQAVRQLTDELLLAHNRAVDKPGDADRQEPGYAGKGVLEPFAAARVPGVGAEAASDGSRSKSHSRRASEASHHGAASRGGHHDLPDEYEGGRGRGSRSGYAGGAHHDGEDADGARLHSVGSGSHSGPLRHRLSAGNSATDAPPGEHPVRQPRQHHVDAGGHRLTPPLHPVRSGSLHTSALESPTGPQTPVASGHGDAVPGLGSRPSVSRVHVNRGVGMGEEASKAAASMVRIALQNVGISQRHSGNIERSLSATSSLSGNDKHGPGSHRNSANNLTLSTLGRTPEQRVNSPPLAQDTTTRPARRAPAASASTVSAATDASQEERHTGAEDVGGAERHAPPRRATAEQVDTAASSERSSASGSAVEAGGGAWRGVVTDGRGTAGSGGGGTAGEEAAGSTPGGRVRPLRSHVSGGLSSGAGAQQPWALHQVMKSLETAANAAPGTTRAAGAPAPSRGAGDSASSAASSSGTTGGGSWSQRSSQGTNTGGSAQAAGRSAGAAAAASGGPGSSPSSSGAGGRRVAGSGAGNTPSGSSGRPAGGAASTSQQGGATGGGSARSGAAGGAALRQGARGGGGDEYQGGGSQPRPGRAGGGGSDMGGGGDRRQGAGKEGGKGRSSQSAPASATAEFELKASDFPDLSGATGR